MWVGSEGSGDRPYATGMGMVARWCTDNAEKTPPATAGGTDIGGVFGSRSDEMIVAVGKNPRKRCCKMIASRQRRLRNGKHIFAGLFAPRF